MTATTPSNNSYEQGHHDGEMSVLADLQIALGDVVPDGVDLGDHLPADIAKYVDELQTKAATPWLTETEHRVLEHTAEVWNHLNVAVEGPNREADLAELALHVHAIQRAVMSNAAARAYPGMIRALGASLRPEDES